MLPLRLSSLLVLCLVVAGCASPDIPSPEVPTAGNAGDSTQAQEATVSTISAMTPSQKREQIAESFPLEVPVPMGTVVRGGAQGDEAWEYGVDVDASAPALADWYRSAYASRSWEIVSDTVAGTADGGSPETTRYQITLRKGQAESRVTISTVGQYARASVILGVGVPVLETQ